MMVRCPNRACTAPHKHTSHPLVHHHHHHPHTHTQLSTSYYFTKTPPSNQTPQVFEYLDSDLEALIKAKGVVLSPSDVKAYMLMLLKALEACHSHWVLHRDIKPNNMLISKDGE